VEQQVLFLQEDSGWRLEDSLPMGTHAMRLNDPASLN